MKISAIGPFAGPQENDIDRPEEVVAAELNSGSDAPIAELSAGSDPSDEGGETREGLLRLMDFIARKQTQKARAAKSGNSKLNKALSAYERFTAKEVKAVGQNLNRWR
jgi:hypothetical protein